MRPSSNSGFATPFVYGSYGECVARIDALAAGLDKGGEKLLDKNEDGMLLVGYYVRESIRKDVILMSSQLMYCLYFSLEST